MLYLYGTVSNTNYFIELPSYEAFGIVISKPIASRQTLAGSVIHQTAQKNQTAGTAKYTGKLKTTHADILQTLDNSTSTIFLSTGTTVYTVTMDAKIMESKTPGKKDVEIEFRIISRLYPTS